MLAYELFLSNKKTNRNLDARNLRPIKKIFVLKGKVTIDSKTPEDYGSKKFPKNKNLQNWLSMPSWASNPEKLNLPDKRTGKNSPKPYVEFDCEYKKTENESKIIVSFPKKGKFIATISLDNQTVENPGFENKSQPQSELEIVMAGKDRTNTNINDDNYDLDGVRLFDAYVKNEILTDDSKISFTLFKKICKEFFNFVNTRTVPNEFTKYDETIFSLIILPNDKKITFTDHTTLGVNSWIDAAGNTTNIIADKPTILAKFLSFDDPSFTPNGMKGDEFYKNIGIGYKTLDKVSLARDQEINVAGLHWYFIDTVSPNKDFKILKKGIFAQLYNNYEQLKSRANRNYVMLSSMKVICIQMDQFRSKNEIFIDENLTMTKLETIFSGIGTHDIPFSAAEILIESTKSSTLWTYYLKFVNSVLRGYGFRDTELIEIFTIFSKKAIFNKDNPWFENENYSLARDWFKKAEFCRKMLSNSSGYELVMNPNEEFAFSIGKIAGRYVWFREEVDEKNKSVKDILTYSKYDKITLHYVLEIICRGIQITRVNNDETQRIKMQKYVFDNNPSTDIDNASSSINYSYFFYRGVYSTITGVN